MKVRVYFTKTEHGVIDLDLDDNLSENGIDKEINLMLDRVEAGHESLNDYIHHGDGDYDCEWERLDKEDD